MCLHGTRMMKVQVWQICLFDCLISQGYKSGLIVTVIIRKEIAFTKVLFSQATKCTKHVKCTKSKLHQAELESWKYFKEQNPCLKSHGQEKVHEKSCNFHEAYLGLCYILIYSCITIQIITRVDDWTGWNHKHRYISTLPIPSLGPIFQPAGVGVISKVDEFAATIILPPWVRDLFHFLNESWDYVTMCEKMS